MRHFVIRRTSARLVFIIGLLLMFLGSAFLLGPVAVSRFFILISFFFVLLGALCAVLAIKLNKRSLYLFFAALFLQVGLFLFLSSLHIIPVSFARGWPLLSVFSGIALFPTGWHRHGTIRARYLVSSIAFVVLGCVLLVFSLDLVSFSLAQFVKNWWPLLVVLAGFILILVSLSTKNAGEPKR
jgi:drug/metabolite transporter (DMT)-like permease